METDFKWISRFRMFHIQYLDTAKSLKHNKKTQIDVRKTWWQRRCLSSYGSCSITPRPRDSRLRPISNCISSRTSFLVNLPQCPTSESCGGN